MSVTELGRAIGVHCDHRETATLRRRGPRAGGSVRLSFWGLIWAMADEISSSVKFGLLSVTRRIGGAAHAEGDFQRPAASFSRNFHIRGGSDHQVRPNSM